MKSREAATRMALRLRWRLLPAATFFPSPLLLAIFRNSSLEGWTLLSAITFALLLTVWIGIIAWIISPIRNWRMFQVVLMAIACLILGSLVVGPAGPSPVAVLVLGSAAVLLFIAAVKIKAPSAEEIRLAHIANQESSGHVHVSWWLKLLVFVLLAIPVGLILTSLYEMFS